MVERRSPKPFVVGSSPTWPAKFSPAFPSAEGRFPCSKRPRPKGIAWPNKDSQKRSARKARAAERKELEEKHAVSGQAPSKEAPAQAKAEKNKAAKKNGFFSRVRGWFADVKAEMHRVTWPSKAESRTTPLPSS